MNIIECDQYDEAWWDARRGCFTASLASKIITPTGKMSSQYKGEMGRMIAELAELQEPDQGLIETEWMARGSDLENEARLWFNVAEDTVVERVGFIRHDTYPFGCSPDAIFMDGSCVIPVEIKCPKPSTHIQWLIDGGVPPQHRAQVHFQMALMQAPYGYFMSYHPNLDPIVIKVEADDFTENLIHYLDQFCDEFEVAYKLVTGVDYAPAQTDET